jgi:hypothetical protein
MNEMLVKAMFFPDQKVLKNCFNKLLSYMRMHLEQYGIVYGSKKELERVEGNKKTFLRKRKKIPSWLLREKRAFIRLQSQGEIKTEKEFVVIKDKNVLGYGDDLGEILERFKGRYPYLLEETQREEDEAMLSPFVLGIRS